MKIQVIGRLKGYAYAEGLHDMPKDHAQKFLDAEKANLPEKEEKTSKDYSISELREMDLSDKDDSFFEGDDRKSIDQIK